MIHTHPRILGRISRRLLLSAILITAAAHLSLPASGAAAASKIEAGPKGGRLLEKTTPKTEFVLGADRVVTMVFYNDKLEPIAPSGQTATVVASPAGGRVQVEFEQKGDVLVSKAPLPPGEGYTVVVQLRSKADAKPQNFRFKLETHACGECKRPEYACTCGH